MQGLKIELSAEKRRREEAIASTASAKAASDASDAELGRCRLSEQAARSDVASLRVQVTKAHDLAT